MHMYTRHHTTELAETMSCTDGEKKHKVGHVPDGLNLTPRQRVANGWGYVLRLDGKVYYDHGVFRSGP